MISGPRTINPITITIPISAYHAIRFSFVSFRFCSSCYCCSLNWGYVLSWHAARCALARKQVITTTPETHLLPAAAAAFLLSFSLSFFSCLCCCSARFGLSRCIQLLLAWLIRQRRSTDSS